MPDTVCVVIVVVGCQEHIDGDAHRSHGDARQEIEGPALPRGGITLVPVPAAVHLKQTVILMLVQAGCG